MKFKNEGLNRKLLTKVINQITLHPETHDQREWHTGCGTKHCFAGWVAVFEKVDEVEGEGSFNWQSPEDFAAERLGIGSGLTGHMFDADRTIKELQEVCKELLDGSRDLEGYDIEGYDIEGYDIHGYDIEGYDIHGYDIEGYNHEGYDMDSYNAYHVKKGYQL